MRDEYKVCAICGIAFYGYGHSAEPIVPGQRCCDACNDLVILERLRMGRNGELVAEEQNG